MLSQESQAGASILGDFHYVPVLFQEGMKIRRDQRLLLAILGTVLGDLQGAQPEIGIVFLGDRCRGAKVHLTASLRERARDILREIQESLGDVKPPRLTLIGHCQQCEFRERCRHQAQADDDLSLLDGMGEKELRKHNRKGIFTVTQLSCTFRLRKRVKRQQQPHYFALQAAAIRDRKVYVLKPPPVPVSPVRVYFDIEGDSEKTFAYLLGLVIDDRGIETKYSLWADSPRDEQAIFGSMLEILGRYDAFTLFHSWELRIILPAADEAEPSGTIRDLGRLLARSTNLLPTISSHIYFPVYSNGLKAIGRLLGCEWTDPDASGLKSIVLRSRWEREPADELKRELERYNLEDCLALKRITDVVLKICEEVPKESGQPEITLEGCLIARAADISTGTTRREYGE